MAPPPRLETRALTVERGGRPVARDVDLRVHAGEVVALAGPSGAGKSSLLRCLVRLDEPAAGAVLVDGTDARELAPTVLRRRVGYVAQHPVMLPGSVRDNLAYGLDALGPDRAAECVTAAGLDRSFLGRPATELSGGEAARAAVARALARDPAALLLDEPTAALDEAAAAATAELVRRLAGRGLAILVVTHDPAWADAVSTRAMTLREGVLA